MIRYLKCFVSTAVLVLSVVNVQCQSVADDPAVREVKALIDNYAKTIEDVDLQLAAKVWATSDDVSFIHPRGHEHGWEQVKTNFYENTMGANFSQRSLTIHDLVIHVSGDSAWAEFYWNFAVKMKKDGKPLNSKGRETQVLRKTDQGWRIFHVHYSAMPVKGEREGF